LSLVTRHSSLVTHLLPSAFCLLLSAFCIANAQIEKNELILTPEIEEMVVAKLKTEPVEEFYRYGIKNKEQVENLQLGRAIREYVINIDNDTLIPQGWRVPVMYEGKTLFLAYVTERGANFSYFGSPRMGEDIHHYEREDLMGIVTVRNIPWEYYYIRRENKDVFVQVFEPETREYFKNEYSLSELISLRNRVLELRNANLKELRQEVPEIYGTNQVNEDDIFDTNFPQKHELKMTPELTEMLASNFKYRSVQSLSDYGITNRAQLENLQLGKPIPVYRIDIENENLVFTRTWSVPVMSNGEPLFTADVMEWSKGECRYSGAGGVAMAEILRNYEHKDLIIGYLSGYPSEKSYLIIRKEQKDIFVYVSRIKTHESFNEYTFSEIINSLKK